MPYNDDEKSLLRRKMPKRRTTSHTTLERRPLPDGRATPRDKQILPRRLKDKGKKPSRFDAGTDSLNTSMYAKPFRKPKNLTDSLGTASPIARKYRKLGSK